jgi:uncharacterized protein
LHPVISGTFEENFISENIPDQHSKERIMRKQLPLLMALGAGIAFVTFFKQQLYKQNARQWALLRAERRTQGGPGTAFITGASSGIGEAFARELAHRGYNLVILARREQRLRALADQLQRDYSVQVKTLVADLNDPADLELAAMRVSEITDLDLLVNNAGFGHAGFFTEIDPQEEQSMIRLHVEASVRLARAALPGMIERGFGALINVSSMAGLITAAGSHTYGATKAYLNFFSESLSYELAGTGVRVQALCPGFTHTEIHKSGRPNLPDFLWLNAGDVVSESLKGLREGRVIVIPGRLYRLLYALVSNSLVRPLASFAQSRGLGRRLARSG